LSVLALAMPACPLVTGYSLVSQCNFQHFERVTPVEDVTAAANLQGGDGEHILTMDALYRLS
jgi:hypothetical protein